MHSWAHALRTARLRVHIHPHLPVLLSARLPAGPPACLPAFALTLLCCRHAWPAVLPGAMRRRMNHSRPERASL